MNISYNWLNDVLRTGLDAEEIARHLTRVGMAVEGIHAHGDDFVLDIDLTSNRPDCLSHRGIARELAVATEQTLDGNTPQAPASADAGLVTIDDPEFCNRFTARVIRGVKVGSSPQWLVDRLEAIGERSINNVADITNYVMHEVGQPMHAFDLDKLAEQRIVVRRARHGETITTLDEVDRKLDTSMLAICDAEKPAAIGGIMGGLDSSITEETVNVLLEVAYFQRANIRSTSRKLNLATEASYRFERGTDVLNLIRASERASDLICELAGGKKGEFVDVFPEKFVANTIVSQDLPASVKRLTGLSISGEECIRILTALGIGHEAGNDGSSKFTTPSWRHDLSIEEDLVEEVARHAGYENIRDELPAAGAAGEYQPAEHRERRMRSALTNTGFDEALSYSFIDTRHDEVFEIVPGLVDMAVEEPYVTLQDSVIEGALRMRPSILPGLLDAVRLNLNHQRRDVKLFEIGKVFATANSEDGLPTEQKAFALVITGSETEQDRAMGIRGLDFYDLKGALEGALAASGVGDLEFAAADLRHLRRGQTALVSVEGVEIGSIGRLSDEIAAGYKFRQPVYVGEINLSAALAAEVESTHYRPLAKYPGVVRDVSFVVDRSVEFASIRDSILRQGVELCRSVAFVDIYEGKGLAENERSITVRLEYRSSERTLIEDEVEALHQKIIERTEADLSISRRY